MRDVKLDENTTSSPPKTQRRKKHKVVIHSSPFERCIQTSVGIASGLGQFHKLAEHHHVPAHHAPNHHMHARSPFMHARENSASPRLSAIIEPEEGESTAPSPKHESPPSRSPKNGTPPPQKTQFQSSLLQHPHLHHHTKFNKATLRIDAFLGEWLSPDYFEQITPPPGSVMMVASAKANLLRRGEEIRTGNESLSATGHFPGGWGSASATANASASASANTVVPTTTIASAAAPIQALPQRGHHGSDAGLHAATKTAGTGLTRLQTTNLENQNKPHYTPPTPTYAISGSDAIPAGYVAHARDACVDVDYAWDSMRTPQDWGNGGEYGEEWSAMHKRFRVGIGKMVEWYVVHDVGCGNLAHGKTAGSRRGSKSESDAGAVRSGVAASETVDEEETDDEEEADTVLVLVTHGAGCNALIGALTNEPVLMDIGLASLTMAVRKEPTDSNTSPTATTTSPTNADETRPPLHTRHPSLTSILPSKYSMSLVASTEHLRQTTTGSNASLSTPYLSALSNPSNSPTTRSTSSPKPSVYRNNNRNGSSGIPSTAQLENFTLGAPARTFTWGSGGSAIGSGAGGLHRSSSLASHTVGSGSGSSSTASAMQRGRSSSSGLWGGSSGSGTGTAAGNGGSPLFNATSADSISASTSSGTGAGTWGSTAAAKASAPTPAAMSMWGSSAAILDSSAESSAAGSPAVKPVVPSGNTNAGAGATAATATATATERQKNNVSPLTVGGSSNVTPLFAQKEKAISGTGLWGSGSGGVASVQAQEGKRRWTVTEH